MKIVHKTTLKKQYSMDILHTFLNDGGWIILAKLDNILGGCCMSDSKSTFRFGVKGSGRRMLRGNALRIRLRICIQFGEMTSQKA